MEECYNSLRAEVLAGGIKSSSSLSLPQLTSFCTWHVRSCSLGCHFLEHKTWAMIFISSHLTVWWLCRNWCQNSFWYSTSGKKNLFIIFKASSTDLFFTDKEMTSLLYMEICSQRSIAYMIIIHVTNSGGKMLASSESQWAHKNGLWSKAFFPHTQPKIVHGQS